MPKLGKARAAVVKNRIKASAPKFLNSPKMVRNGKGRVSKYLSR